jgi:hypothetical protein
MDEVSIRARTRMRDAANIALSPLMDLRWMRMRDFLEIADEEDASVYTDLLELKNAFVSEPLTPEMYKVVIDSAQQLGLRQAMFITAGSIYTAQGFVAASRMVVFGAAVDLLCGHGLPLENACWNAVGEDALTLSEEA